MRSGIEMIVLKSNTDFSVRTNSKISFGSPYLLPSLAYVSLMLYLARFADRIDVGPITPTCSSIAVTISPDIGSSGNSCDISKRLPTLACLSRHPDSSQRAFEEVRHAV